MREGWYQVLFERDLVEGVTPVDFVRPLFALKTRKGVRVFDAVCPHRGANLAYGGVPDQDAIVCPFHDRRIGLGASCGSGYEVKEYRTLLVGGMLFVGLSDHPDDEFVSLMTELDRDHYFINGFTLPVNVPADMVIENGFDATHFRPVHGVRNTPQLQVERVSANELVAAGAFMVPLSPWQRELSESGLLQVPYRARAFGPGVLVSHMGGEDPYYVITCAAPVAPRRGVARLSIAVPSGPGGAPPDADRCEYLLRQMQSGLEKDQRVWDRMVLDTPNRFAPEDASVVAFRQFVNSLAEVK